MNSPETAPMISRHWCFSQGLELLSEADSLLPMEKTWLRFAVVFLKIHVFRHHSRHPATLESIWIIWCSMILNDHPNCNWSAKNTFSIGSFVDWMIDVPYVPWKAMILIFELRSSDFEILGMSWGKGRAAAICCAISSDELSHLTHLTNATWDVGRTTSCNMRNWSSPSCPLREVSDVYVTVEPHVFGAHCWSSNLCFDASA